MNKQMMKRKVNTVTPTSTTSTSIATATASNAGMARLKSQVEELREHQRALLKSVDVYQASAEASFQRERQKSHLAFQKAKNDFDIFVTNLDFPQIQSHKHIQNDKKIHQNPILNQNQPEEPMTAQLQDKDNQEQEQDLEEEQQQQLEQETKKKPKSEDKKKSPFKSPGTKKAILAILNNSQQKPKQTPRSAQAKAKAKPSNKQQSPTQKATAQKKQTHKSLAMHTGTGTTAKSSKTRPDAAPILSKSKPSQSPNFLLKEEEERQLAILENMDNVDLDSKLQEYERRAFQSAVQKALQDFASFANNQQIVDKPSPPKQQTPVQRMSLQLKKPDMIVPPSPISSDIQHDISNNLLERTQSSSDQAELHVETMHNPTTTTTATSNSHQLALQPHRLVGGTHHLLDDLDLSVVSGSDLPSLVEELLPKLPKPPTVQTTTLDYYNNTKDDPADLGTPNLITPANASLPLLVATEGNDRLHIANANTNRSRRNQHHNMFEEQSTKTKAQSILDQILNSNADNVMGTADNYQHYVIDPGQQSDQSFIPQPSSSPSPVPHNIPRQPTSSPRQIPPPSPSYRTKQEHQPPGSSLLRQGDTYPSNDILLLANDAASTPTGMQQTPGTERQQSPQRTRLDLSHYIY
ncbi:expressed unknown protein [Seminavis robusta]|uniref:Uncharacterized protein n=1 Tax=Seminavis robusta TaxID=568900 RepID=A0A9N8DSH9_9STRA|nr:expressed unknown protein [Seminavis robusta]|eukprot:Sro321_g116700.1 n/a (636) ;mRNA; f:25404-27486